MHLTLFPSARTATTACAALFAVLILIGLCRQSAAPLSLSVSVRGSRIVQKNGVEGLVSPWTRWRDALSTALEIWGQGVSLKSSVRHALRSGPLSEAYVSVLEKNVSDATKAFSQKLNQNRTGFVCQGDDCQVAVDGFATVGRVNYTFANYEHTVNSVGVSNQVMVSCVCANPTCNSSVLVRPVSLDEKGTDGFCLFEKINGKFSDCGSELLRVSTNPQSHAVAELPLNRPTSWNYSVANERYTWQARGDRSWIIPCTNSSGRYVREDVLTTWQQDPSCIRDNTNHSREIVGRRNERGFCAPPANSNVQYVRDSNETRSSQCFQTYRFAISAASNRASQQDILATGRDESTFVEEKPTLYYLSELLLFISPGVLALLFAISIFKDPYRLETVSKGSAAVVVLMLLLTAAAEMVVLFVQLYWESFALRWKTSFAFVDAGIAWAESFNIPTIDGANAEYSVIVLTAVLGRAGVRRTWFWFVLGCAIVLTVLIAVIMVLTVFRLRRMRHMKKSRQFGRPKQNEYVYRVLERIFPSDRYRAKRRCEVEDEEDLKAPLTEDKSSATGAEGI